MEGKLSASRAQSDEPTFFCAGGTGKAVPLTVSTYATPLVDSMAAVSIVGQDRLEQSYAKLETDIVANSPLIQLPEVRAQQEFFFGVEGQIWCAVGRRQVPLLLRGVSRGVDKCHARPVVTRAAADRFLPPPQLGVFRKPRTLHIGRVKLRPFRDIIEVIALPLRRSQHQCTR